MNGLHILILSSLLFLMASVVLVVMLAVPLIGALFSSRVRSWLRAPSRFYSTICGIAGVVVVLYIVFMFILPDLSNTRFRRWTSNIKEGMKKEEVTRVMKANPVSTNYDRWYFRSFPWGGKTHPMQLDFYCDFETGIVVKCTQCFTPDN